MDGGGGGGCAEQAASAAAAAGATAVAAAGRARLLLWVGALAATAARGLERSGWGWRGDRSWSARARLLLLLLLPAASLLLPPREAQAFAATASLPRALLPVEWHLREVRRGVPARAREQVRAPGCEVASRLWWGAPGQHPPT